MNTQQLIDNATKKGYKVEVNINEELTKLFNQPQGMIGIYKGKNNWHWFKYDGDYTRFDHTYNWASGKVKKGVMHGLRVYMSLEK
jgi:hypothetical protein